MLTKKAVRHVRSFGSDADATQRFSPRSQPPEATMLKLHFVKQLLNACYIHTDTDTRRGGGGQCVCVCVCVCVRVCTTVREVFDEAKGHKSITVFPFFPLSPLFLNTKSWLKCPSLAHYAVPLSALFGKQESRLSV